MLITQNKMLHSKKQHCQHHKCDVPSEKRRNFIYCSDRNKNSTLDRAATAADVIHANISNAARIYHLPMISNVGFWATSHLNSSNPPVSCLNEKTVLM